MGAAIGAGFNVAQKVWNGEKIDGEEVVEEALKSGADFGFKAATAGAVKVGAEKGVLTVIPKGTPAATIANIAHVAIENAKVIGKVATGELTPREGVTKMEQVTVSTVAGIAAGIKGAEIGAAIGSLLGPIGIAVGGFIGGTIGYMAGSKVGKEIMKGTQKVREVAKDTAKSIGSKIGSGIKSVCSGVLSIFS